MVTNLEKYKKDLAALIDLGGHLHNAIQCECYPAEFKEAIAKELKGEAKDVLGKLPSFSVSYQAWYSEAKAVIRQVLPDRLLDFCSPLREAEVSQGYLVRELSNRGLPSGT